MTVFWRGLFIGCVIGASVTFFIIASLRYPCNVARSPAGAIYAFCVVR